MSVDIEVRSSGTTSGTKWRSGAWDKGALIEALVVMVGSVRRHDGVAVIIRMAT